MLKSFFKLTYCFIFVSNKKQNDMTFTGEIVKFENGKTFGIHSKMTKKGIRYYMYTRDRMIPISRKRINEHICLD